MLNTYLKKITNTVNQGDAREESFYSSLEGLLIEYAESTNRKKIHVTTLPKKTEAGNPDFRVWDGNHKQVGYIEAKAPTVTNLDQIEDTEQLKRYLGTFPNVILTNFLEFRLYRDGDLIAQVQIARPAILNKLKAEPPVEKETQFFELFEKFFSFSLPKVYSARTLAVELAKRTKFLKDEVVTQELKEEDGGNDRKFITGFYEAFRKYLIAGLSKEDFADLYSQTIAYGLFAARTRSENGFNRKLAYNNIPPTIGILRDVFEFISLGSLPQQMEWIIDDISEVLAVTDVNKILHQYFHEGKGKDPIVHFYETFLSEYDPKTREKRGVYYTPEPVVSYIVRSLNIILKEKFGKPDGFASSSVTVLDPAAGTLTFPAEAAKLAVEEFVARYGEGGKENFIKEYVLRNFYAFELMMAPYAIGHLKMSFLLEELGYKLHADDRFKLYLTNTLEMEELEQTDLPGMASLSEESHLAGRVKKDQPILVIMGNPPYSVSSANKSNFIEKEMELYKEDVRSEKNIQPLSDDYIKFIRFAHWKIEKSGKGIIGMITNNHYLSGSIQRGMRKKLLESFSEIYILNLHGNSRIGEKSPDGSPDENVFDIQQGVSIALFVKNKEEVKRAKVFYHDFWGQRESKYDYLKFNDLKTTKWTELQLDEPDYFFVYKDFSLRSIYTEFCSIPKIFNVSSTGINTHRDHFLVGFTADEIKNRMLTFTSKVSDDVITQALNLKDTRDWKLKTAREGLMNTNWKSFIRSYNYRPYDIRTICYTPILIDRGSDRWVFMTNFFRKNLGLCIKRSRYIKVFGFRHAFVTSMISDGNFFGDRTTYFPLCIYPATEKNDLFNHKEQGGERKSNFNPEFYKTVCGAYGKDVSPEEIFYYIYGILYSNIYRTKYAEFLKIDFPRVPFTKSYKVFNKVSKLGERLVNLHLLKSPALDSPIAKFHGEGDMKVEKPVYKDGRVYINKEQYFEGVEGNVWEYQIGGYQVCNKWLKDRKGRKVSLDDIKHYCKVVTSLKKTIELQKQIDSIYEEVEKDIIDFKLEE